MKKRCIKSITVVGLVKIIIKKFPHLLLGIVFLFMASRYLSVMFEMSDQHLFLISLEHGCHWIEGDIYLEILK